MILSFCCDFSWLRVRMLRVRWGLYVRMCVCVDDCLFSWVTERVLAVWLFFCVLVCVFIGVTSGFARIYVVVLLVGCDACGLLF